MTLCVNFSLEYLANFTIFPSSCISVHFRYLTLPTRGYDLLVHVIALESNVQRMRVNVSQGNKKLVTICNLFKAIFKVNIDIYEFFFT